MLFKILPNEFYLFYLLKIKKSGLLKIYSTVQFICLYACMHVWDNNYLAKRMSFLGAHILIDVREETEGGRDCAEGLCHSTLQSQQNKQRKIY